MDDRVKKVRLEINETAWALIEEVARLSMTTPKAVVHVHLMEVIDALTKSNATVKLSSAWPRAWENISKKVDEGLLQRDSDAIDFSVLCTSRTTNSGFEGVYAHSNPARGFIAHGRDPETKKPGKHLGLFPTAAQAAWVRYQHYKKHNMPYGKLEEAMEKMRNDVNFRPMKPSERWIYGMAIWSLAQKGIILPDLPAKDRIFENQTPDFD